METKEIINNILKIKKMSKKTFGEKVISLNPILKSTGEVPGIKTIYSYLNISEDKKKTREIPIELISCMSQVLEVPEQDLFEPQTKTEIVKKELKENISKYSSYLPSSPDASKIDIAYFENSFACAGSGLINYDEVPKPMTFDRGFLEQQLGTKNFKNLHVIKVKGNSMDPTIKSGEFVMISPFENDGYSVENGSIYVINYYDDIMIKRVIRNNKTKEVLLNSENKEEHPQIKITGDDENYFNIVGRVIAHFSFM